MAKELVEYSARLQAAVDKILINPAFSVQGGRRIRGRNTLTEQVGRGSGGYSGYFKVIPGQAKGTLRIVDGANQNAAICGKTDVGDVSMETLTSQEGTLYLIMKAISATTYTQTFEWMIPSGAVGWTEIATVDSDGVITQRWTGNTIYWGQRYLI